MQLRRHLSGIILVLAVAVLLAVGPLTDAGAAYSVGFKTNQIEITSPTTSGFHADGVLRIEGRSTLDCVWVALRGPDKETETVPLEVRDGAFGAEIRLRFGAGKYTVWADDNARSFSGKIRFELQNRNAEELRYCAPSAFVDSDHPQIAALAGTLAGGLGDDTAKAKAIHGWVTGNISYDYAAYLNPEEHEMLKASTVLQSRQGVCRDYAVLTAALARAADVPARVVYGQARSGPGANDEYHAWNEFLIDGRWVSLDPTWDAGYIQNGSFVRAQSDQYFMPAVGEFKQTHRATKYTTH